MLFDDSGKYPELLNIVWKQKVDCILDVHITNLGAPSNIQHRKHSVSRARKEEEIPPNSPGLTLSLLTPLWFHAMEWLEMKPR